VPDTGPISRVDAGWLFLVAGLALIVCTVLIPAADDLDEAIWQRDRARALERHRIQRLDRHTVFLEAIDARDPDLILSLASTQLNQIPADRRPLEVTAGIDGSASVFPALEPPDLTLPERKRVDSTLARLTVNPRSRLWLLAAASVSVLIGLLPPATRRSGNDG
jgi:hypothetical protein